MKKYIFNILIALLTTLLYLPKNKHRQNLCLIKRLPLLKKQVE